MRRDVVGLEQQVFDVLVVGGGIHGAWTALRAARAGLSVALVEKSDFGAATSANSLKILHGGLRYLQHLNFSRMRSSIRARREFARSSPRLIRPLPCLMPLQMLGIRSPWILGPALLANEIISWDRNSLVRSSARIPAGQLVGAQRCSAQIAPLADMAPAAGARWWDAVILDVGRLTLQPVIEAAREGAVVANHVEATALLTAGNTVHGVTAIDGQSGRAFEIKARVVVDATGPWAGGLSAASGLPTSFRPGGWIGALNLVLRRSLGTDVAIAITTIESAGKSSATQPGGRELFIVPWRNVTMIGTDYHPVSDRSQCDDGAPAYAVSRLLEKAAAIAPRAQLSDSDVALVHWGLLPARSPDDSMPQSSPIIASGDAEAGADGLVVIIGEKLTSAPVLAERALKRIAETLSRVTTSDQHSKQAGPADARDDDALLAPVSVSEQRLFARYGAEWSKVEAHANGDRSLLAPIESSAESSTVEVIHAVQEEMALDLDDLCRRLGIAEAGVPAQKLLARCAQIAAAYWRYDEATTAQAVAESTERFAARGRE